MRFVRDYLMGGFLMLLVFAIPFLASAQEPLQVPDDAWIPLAKELLDAMVNGAWWQAAAAALALIGFGLRRFGPSIWPPLGTVPGVIITSFVLAFGGGLLNALAAGTGLDWPTIWTALKIGGSAAGGWGALELIWNWMKNKMPSVGMVK